MPKAAMPLKPSPTSQPKAPHAGAAGGRDGESRSGVLPQTKSKRSSPASSGTDTMPLMPPKSVPPPVPGDDEDESEQTDVHKIPSPDALDDTVAERLATDLLTEANEIKLRHDKDEIRLKQLRTELFNLSEIHEVPGIRFGGLAFVYGGMRTTLRLDKKKLIENGVDPDTIRASYTETKPFQASRFVKVKTT